jgi:hypothetical protein
MSNIHTRFLLGGLFALVLVGSSAGGAGANETILPCLQRDIQLLTLVEERGNTNAAPGQVLADAMLAMMDARRACLGGRVGDALAQYDRIVLRVFEASFDRVNPPAPGLAQN